jgi:hypothetical protein
MDVPTCKHFAFFLTFGLTCDGASVPVVVVLFTLDFLHVNVKGEHLHVQVFSCLRSSCIDASVSVVMVLSTLDL